MPKRTNDYQKLILNINKHFSSSTAKVTESKLIYDSTSEQDREIDICIEDTVNGYSYLIGIECTTLRRKVGVPKLDEIVAKHRAVNINKTVIVSEHGFTETAKTQAAKQGVELITYEAAANKDWPDYIKQILETKVIHVQTEVKAIQIGWVEGQSMESFQLSENVMVQLNEKDLIPVPYFLAQMLNETPQDVLEKKLEHCPSSGGFRIQQGWELSPPMKVVGGNNTSAYCNMLAGEFLISRTPIQPKMRGGDYAGKFIASGTQFDTGPFSDATITYTARESSTVDGSPEYEVSISLNTKDID